MCLGVDVRHVRFVLLAGLKVHKGFFHVSLQENLGYFFSFEMDS